MAISDRIIIMRRAHIVEDGTPVSLYLRPREIFTGYFLGESNILEGDVTEADEDSLTVSSGGISITARNTGFQTGEKVIVMIRPELVELGGEGVEGKVLKKLVEGFFSRFTVDLSGVKIIVKQPYSMVSNIGEGSMVKVMLPKEHVLVYKYPGRGLYSELSLY
jgi:ABC-type Fe3+/spermidine/putrescine transport system ATPase subunit